MNDQRDRVESQTPARQAMIFESVAHLAEWLLRSPDWTVCIDGILQRLGQASDASRCYLFVRHEPRLLKLQHEWVAEGVKRMSDKHGLLSETFGEGDFDAWDLILLQNRIVRCNPALDPDLTEPERSWLRQAGIRAVLQIPVFVEGELWGFFGFDDCEREREWNEGEIEGLKAVAALLAGVIQRARMEQALETTLTRLERRVEERTEELVQANEELATEVRERRRAEAALRESEQRLQLALEGSGQGLVDLDMRTGNAVVSPEYARMLGYEPEEFVETNQKWLERLHPDERDAVRQYFLEYIRGERSEYRVEFRQRMKDGRYKWILSSAKIVEWDEQGNPVRMSGTHTDIHARKTAQQQLEESRAQLQTITSLITDYVYCGMLHEEGTAEAIWAAGPYEQITGYTVEQVQAKPRQWLDVIHPQDRHVLHDAKETILAGQHVVLDYRIITGRGETRWIRDFVNPIWDEKRQRVTQVIGGVQDISEVRRAEEELRQSEQLFSAVLDNLPIIVFIKNRQGRILLVNKQYEEIAGIPREEIIGKTDDEIFSQPLLQQIKANDRQVFETGGLHVFEEHLIHHGEEHIAEVFKSLQSDLGFGEPVLLGIAIEVTARKRAEAALRESEQRLQLALEGGGQGLFDLDLRTGDAVVSPEHARMLGDEPERQVVTSLEWLDRLHPDERESVRQYYLEYIRRERPDYRIEFRQRMKDGSYKWILSSAKIVERDEAGQPIRMIGTITDITDRKVAQQQLEENREQLRLITSVISDYAYCGTLREDGRTDGLWAAGPYEDITGYTFEEVRAKPNGWFDLVHPEDRHILLERKDHIFDGRQVVLDYRIITARGEVRWIRDYVNPIWDSKQRCVKQFVGAVKDITESRRADEELRQRERFLQGVLDNSPVVIFVKTRDGRLLLVNRMFEELLGMPREEMIGRPNHEIFPEVSFDEIEAHDRIVFEQGGQHEFEETLIIHGEERKYLVVKSLQPDIGFGEPVLLGVTIDVTPHRRAEAALRDSERQYRALFELESDAICLIDNETGRLLEANQAATQLYGYSREKLLKLRNVDISAEPQDVVRDSPPPSATASFHWHRDSRGRVFPVELTGGFFEWRGRPVHIVAIRDITGRFEAESQRERLLQAIENAGEGISIWNHRWKLTFANAAQATIFQAKRPQAINGRTWKSFFAADDLDRVNQVMRTVEQDGWWRGRLLARRKTDSPIPLAVTLNRLGNPEDDFLIVANIRDLSREEAHLDKIRKLTQDAGQSLESERARISRELHDELGQILTAVHLNLAWLKKATNTVTDTKLAGRLAETENLVNTAVDAVRNMSKQLRPPILDNKGLADALKSYAADFSTRSEVKCTVRVTPGDLEVRDPYATCLYRIAQEALTNVARHAKATKAELFLAAEADHLALEISDNGKGGVPEDFESIKSLGVAGMRERATSLGGELRIINLPGGGVRVSAQLPWQPITRRKDS